MRTHTTLADKERPESTERYVAILRRDPCSYCGAPPTATTNRYKQSDVDHIQPQHRGGIDLEENMTAACSSCNSSKRTKTLLGFLLYRLYATERQDAERALNMWRLQGNAGL